MTNLAIQPSSDTRSSTGAAVRSTPTISALTIAGIGAVIMIDLAAENFSGGSALRWWAVGAAAGYIAFTAAAIRRRVGAISYLIIALVFTLGLAAAAAWRTAGVTDGVHFAGQPTARVLAGLTVIALSVAIVTSLRATNLPLAVRLVSSFLALYGVAAFALGAWQGTAYPALFVGSSFWHALPRWLQGGFLGGLVSLPIALVIALAAGARGKRNWSAPTIIVLASALAIAVSAFRVGSGAGQAGGPFNLNAVGINVPDTPRDAQSQPDPRAMEDAAAFIKGVADGPEPSTFNVEKTADEIGNSPASLFAYVRDHVRTQIYSRVLRGARGTLMGGAGNAWDQALLLAAMLRHHGRQVRFAHVHVTPEVAARIVDRMFSDAGRTHAVARSVQIPDSLRMAARATLAQIQSDRQQAQTDLLSALDRAHVSLGDTATSEQTLESEAADHLFVEYRDGDQWIALDPVATATPGTQVAPGEETFSDVPDGFYHHVTIRVMIEERHQQKLEQQEAFRLPKTAAALYGEQVLLSHRFDRNPQGGWRARPILRIGTHSYAARSFTGAGLLKKNGNGDLNDKTRQMASQLGQVFGDSKTQPAAPPPTAEGDLTAESLEIEFTDPAKHSEIVRREIIDRIGPIARSNNTAGSAFLAPITAVTDFPLQLAGIYAMAFAAGPLDPMIPVHRLSPTDRLFEDARALRNARLLPNGSLSAEDEQRFLRVLDKFPAVLQASAEGILTLSQHLAESLHIAGASELFYEATPRLVIASLDPSAGLAIDLRRNGVRAVARTSSASDLVRATLVRSVNDAVIEGDALMPKAQTRRVAAIDIFDRARTEGIRLVTVRGGGILTSIQAPDPARARMASAESSSLLIAPERTPSGNPSQFAWWHLDPSTGEAFSVLDSGLNGFQGDMVEDALITQEIDSFAYEETLPGL